VKTAISISAELLEKADKTARLMRLSRSRFFALAVDDFLQRQQKEQTLRRLNDVYANGLEPAEKGVLKGIRANVRRAVNEHW